MKKGFTLIELLIVIGLIGVLSGFVIVVINPQTQFMKARDANRKKDLSLISNALEQYYADNNRYPATMAVSSLPLAGSPKYIQSIPVDPNTYSYCYTSTTPFQNFVLCARLESGVASVPVGIISCQASGVSYCLTNAF